MIFEILQKYNKNTLSYPKIKIVFIFILAWKLTTTNAQASVAAASNNASMSLAKSPSVSSMIISTGASFAGPFNNSSTSQAFNHSASSNPLSHSQPSTPTFANSSYGVHSTASPGVSNNPTSNQQQQSAGLSNYVSNTVTSLFNTKQHSDSSSSLDPQQRCVYSPSSSKDFASFFEVFSCNFLCSLTITKRNILIMQRFIFYYLRNPCHYSVSYTTWRPWVAVSCLRPWIPQTRSKQLNYFSRTF